LIFIITGAFFSPVADLQKRVSFLKIFIFCVREGLKYTFFYKNKPYKNIRL